MNRALPLLAIAMLSVAPRCWAGIVYDINMNTAPLMGHAAGPFSLEFQLNDGSGTGDANNTATLSNFVFGGGAIAGLPITFGGASGDASSFIILSDASFFNQFVQRFTPGASLSFRLNLSTDVDPGGTPDQFTFAILDGSGAELPTLNAFLNVFVQIDIDSPNPAVLTFGSDSSLPPFNGGTPLNIPAPGVTPVAVPEPATLSLLATALTALGLVIHERVVRRMLDPERATKPDRIQAPLPFSANR